MKFQDSEKQFLRWRLCSTIIWLKLLLLLPIPYAEGKVNLIEITQKTAENQIRHLVEPLLDKFCREQCKLLTVQVSVDLAIKEELAPGFDDAIFQDSKSVAPSGGSIKILIDDKVGPISRSKLIELIQQHLDTLDYPIKIEPQIAHFPQPIGSEGKVTELRDRVAKQFQTIINEFFAQFCPNQCLFVDFEMLTDIVNVEESQYGIRGEYFHENGVAIKIKEISGTLLMDEVLGPLEQNNILNMLKLKTNSFKNVNLKLKSMKFPRPFSTSGSGGYFDKRTGKWHPGAGSADMTEWEKKALNSEEKSSKTTTDSATHQSTSNNKSTQSVSSTNQNSTSDSNVKQERFERIEKIERVESGDAVRAELQKFKVYGLIFACSIISLLIFIAMSGLKPRKESSGVSSVHKVIQSLTHDPASGFTSPAHAEKLDGDQRNALLNKRYEIERITQELTDVYAQQPRVAKHVFGKILTEEGVETTAHYMKIFGESIVVDLLRDPSLQSDINELLEYYAKNTIDLDDDKQLDLLKKLHHRTVSSKLIVLGNRSSNLFDFLAEMDSSRILEMIRGESITVKAIVLTQCDTQKRGVIYTQFDEGTRMKLLAELSRIDHLPRDYINNVSSALKRKQKENPRLNTETLPGSEVLLNLLERTPVSVQKSVLSNLELSNADSARFVRSKLVSINTLIHLRDAQLLEVVLSLKHEELLQFLKGAPRQIQDAVFSKSPKELIVELEEELVSMPAQSREGYLAIERKVLNRMKVMAAEGLINLAETNERMFAGPKNDQQPGFIEATSIGEMTGSSQTRKAAA